MITFKTFFDVAVCYAIKMICIRQLCYIRILIFFKYIRFVTISNLNCMIIMDKIMITILLQYFFCLV